VKDFNAEGAYNAGIIIGGLLTLFLFWDYILFFLIIIGIGAMAQAYDSSKRR
jgi:hypothetical protein